MSAQGKAEQDFQQEYQKAIERIRSMPDGAVGWVLKFLQMELEALTPTEWTLVAFEVAAFVDETGDRYGGMVAPESGWSWTASPANPDVRSLAMDRAGNVYIASDNRLDKLTANNGIYAHDVRPLADGLNAIAALSSNDGVAYIFDAGDGIYAGVIVYDDPVDSN